MESREKLLGHPIHPMLIVFPLGLLATATIFDIAYLITGNTELSTFSFWALVAGIVGGLLAAVFGFLLLPVRLWGGERAASVFALNVFAGSAAAAAFAPAGPESSVLRAGRPTLAAGRSSDPRRGR